MAKIYKITNTLNDKVYIGNTDRDLANRFREHCKKSNITKFENRPMYSDMNKYGVDNFSIELIEEVNNTDRYEREKYWINYYDTFNNGYNSTKGGLGRFTTNINDIEILWKKGYTIKEIHSMTGYGAKNISKILRKNSIATHEEIKDRANIAREKIVAQIDEYDNVVEIYKSMFDIFHDKTKIAHIIDVCKGKRKTAYGYKWVYLDY